MYFVYLECKLEEDSYGCRSCQFNLQISVEKTYLKPSKQQRRHRLAHLDLSRREPWYN